MLTARIFEFQWELYLFQIVFVAKQFGLSLITFYVFNKQAIFHLVGITSAQCL